LSTFFLDPVLRLPGLFLGLGVVRFFLDLVPEVQHRHRHLVQLEPGLFRCIHVAAGFGLLQGVPPLVIAVPHRQPGRDHRIRDFLNNWRSTRRNGFFDKGPVYDSRIAGLGDETGDCGAGLLLDGRLEALDNSLPALYGLWGDAWPPRWQAFARRGG